MSECIARRNMIDAAVRFVKGDERWNFLSEEVLSCDGLLWEAATAAEAIRRRYKALEVEFQRGHA